jgi:hypothetical protein
MQMLERADMCAVARLCAIVLGSGTPTLRVACMGENAFRPTPDGTHAGHSPVQCCTAACRVLGPSRGARAARESPRRPWALTQL